MNISAQINSRRLQIKSALTSCALNASRLLERKRIKIHLIKTEIRKCPIGDLTDSQKKKRADMLDRLDEYWKSERFPRNTLYKFKTPMIRDVYGTPCAMAYLIERSGHGNLVNLLAAQNNLVHIDDVKEGPLLVWLEEHGLKKSEAATIQPGYPYGETSSSFWPGVGLAIPLISLLVGSSVLAVLWKVSPPGQKN